MVSDLIQAGIVTLTLGFIGALVGGYVMWSWLGPKIVTRSVSGIVGPAIYEWLTIPSISTGKTRKITDDDGEVSEVPDIISPLQNIMREAGTYTYQMLCSKMGIDSRKKQVAIQDVQSALMSPDSPLAGFASMISPKLVERAIKDGDYIPIILQMFGPQIEQFISTRVINKGASFTSGDGGMTKW